MKKLIIILIVFSFFACANKKEYKVSLMEIGKPAPNLILKEIIQPKGGKFKNWQQFKGEFVILSFFASWLDNSCEGIKILNYLHTEFKHDSIIFMAVTDESKSEIRKFTRSNNIEGWLGVKVPAESFKNFRVYDRPMSVLINGNGIVTAFMDTNDLNSDIVGEFIGQNEAKDE
jgi:peroxiredoxin